MADIRIRFTGQCRQQQKNKKKEHKKTYFIYFIVESSISTVVLNLSIQSYLTIHPSFSHRGIFSINNIFIVAHKLFGMDSDSAKIGLAFERYVLSRFDLKPYKSSKKTIFQLVSWTGDYGKNYNYSIETDSEPDLIIRHLESGVKFAVECKYRSHLNGAKIGLGKRWFLDHYKKYASNNPDIPTFIAFGLEGQPDNPDRVFCVPIGEVRIANPNVNEFEDYERNPQDMFLFNPTTGILK